MLSQAVATIPTGQVQSDSPKVPVLVRQGPLLVGQQATNERYWYQVGAIGGSSSSNFVGANITIRTVHDQVNDDAHSYWVGSHLSNGAFIQVGYLNGLSTNGQDYCCAWFYEYFPAGQTVCCEPVVGPEGSAGPIGSWHNYSMLHTGNGVWSFYMDGNFLGSTPNLQATASGQYAPAGIAEVAEATSNSDVLGPAEFKDMWSRTFLGSWQPVPTANNLIWYGTGTPLQSVPSNPYGVREVNGLDNDFIAGSNVPQLDSPAAPPGGPQLWPVNPPSNSLSVVFLDTDQASFDPEWFSFRSVYGTNFAFYTDSRAYASILIGDGTWMVDQVRWHTVNVLASSPLVSVPGPTSIPVQTTVSSLKLSVVGWIFGLPTNRARVITYLPDTTNATAETDGSGKALIRFLPPSSYSLRIIVPYGIRALSNLNVPTAEVTIKVMGLAEMLVVIVAPILLAIIITFLAVRRERMRITMMPLISPPVTVAGNCSGCGRLLLSNELVCPTCGNPVRPAPQPSATEPPQNAQRGEEGQPVNGQA